MNTARAIDGIALRFRSTDDALDGTRRTLTGDCAFNGIREPMVHSSPAGQAGSDGTTTAAHAAAAVGPVALGIDIELFDTYALAMSPNPGPPAAEPIGLFVTRTARVVSRAFDDALAAAGGSLPMWLVLVSVKSGGHGNQREIAEAIGIEGPTLTHHLNRMEREGLVTRTRDPRNRRTHVVELTDAGEAAFFGLLAVVTGFDEQLRAGISERDQTTLRRLLSRVSANAVAGDDPITEEPT